MGISLEAISEWEIQLLVLLSFVLQVFLFFTGSLRQRSTNGLLRGTIWLAYLGADLVAIYALGYLSRHEVTIAGKKGGSTLGESHQLPFLWAPFLLIHLGGQDTITAFSMDDNNLWLRHLLNLLVQVTLAIYVFWKSSSWHKNVQLLVPGVLLFAVGIIKYGERTMALMYGKLSNNRASNIQISTERISQMAQQDVYRGLVCAALYTAKITQLLFARSIFTDDMLDDGDYVDHAVKSNTLDHSLVFKLLDLELSLMYNDMYTKAILLRTKSGIVLRCISQVSTIAALVIFAVMGKKQPVSRLQSSIDVGITYTLFVGSILLDVCALFTVLLASPWAWWWLEDQGYRRLARMSWYLVERPETRPLWSNKMSQYSLLSYCGVYDDELVTMSQRVMSMVRKMARAVGIGDEEINRKLFWASKLLDTRYEAVDNELMECVMDDIRSFISYDERIKRQWQHMGPFLMDLEEALVLSFPLAITTVHMITMAYLTSVKASIVSSASAASLAQVSRKLSNYMMYLVAMRPGVVSVLQIGMMSNVGIVLPLLAEYTTGGLSMGTLIEKLKSKHPQFPWTIEQHEAVLKELRDIWVRLLIYAAGKSRLEAHTAQLAEGGELLTFVWLLMAHCGLGDGTVLRIGPTASSPHGNVKVIDVFDL